MFRQNFVLLVPQLLLFGHDKHILPNCVNLQTFKPRYSKRLSRSTNRFYLQSCNSIATPPSHIPLETNPSTELCIGMHLVIPGTCRWRSFVVDGTRNEISQFVLNNFRSVATTAREKPQSEYHLTKRI